MHPSLFAQNSCSDTFICQTKVSAIPKGEFSSWHLTAWAQSQKWPSCRSWPANYTHRSPTKTVLIGSGWMDYLLLFGPGSCVVSFALTKLIFVKWFQLTLNHKYQHKSALVFNELLIWISMLSIVLFFECHIAESQLICVIKAFNHLYRIDKLKIVSSEWITKYLAHFISVLVIPRSVNLDFD